MPYFVRLSCRDCTGEDPLGCFDGETELLHGGRENNFEPQSFATLDDAKRAGDIATCGPPWEFTVEDENGDEVDI